jgi:hypothetical protein
MKHMVITGALSLLLAATVAYAYNITHPTLKEAHGLAEQAIKQVEEAQHDAKGVDFGGHAESAIDHFRKAQAELVAADQYNDSHQKKPKKQ